ncbi:hypothetical protein PR048_021482 [Dryococelus australis]|uniref:Uncharacterized protein n=1 Tax=Dryococelus australis TaxID=614101 RepID=A0ABQ9GYD6_9NEOP|nr:hypothetical protein PR048_021482 [Dryococelus australis]
MLVVWPESVETVTFKQWRVEQLVKEGLEGVTGICEISLGVEMHPGKYMVVIISPTWQGKWEIPENLPINGIVQHDSYVQKSGSDPTRNQTRFTYTKGTAKQEDQEPGRLKKISEFSCESKSLNVIPASSVEFVQYIRLRLEQHLLRIIQVRAQDSSLKEVQRLHTRGANFTCSGKIGLQYEVRLDHHMLRLSHSSEWKRTHSEYCYLMEIIMITGSSEWRCFRMRRESWIIYESH